MYYVGIFGVPVMGVLGIYETTKMKLGFVAWMTMSSWTDCNFQQKTFMCATGTAGFNF
jgi:hypothetical protein